MVIKVGRVLLDHLVRQPLEANNGWKVVLLVILTTEAAHVLQLHVEEYVFCCGLTRASLEVLRSLFLAFATMVRLACSLFEF